MRPLALALVVLLAASPAHAVPITGRVMGTITFNGSTPLPPFYQFTPGEAVSVTFAYDPDLATPTFSAPTLQMYDVLPGTFLVETSGGYRATGGVNRPNSQSASVTNGPADRVEFALGTGFPGLDLTLTDPTGTALTSTALPTAAELLRFPGGTLSFTAIDSNISFLATVAPVADFPVPEPSTLALGAIGVGVLGLAGSRRRKGARPT